MTAMNNQVQPLNNSSSIMPSTERKSAVEASDFKEKLARAAESKDLEALKEASQQFEAYFINTLLKQMRKTIEDSGLVEKSEARKMFEQMLDQEYAKEMSKSGSFGISDAIYEAMKKAYE